MDLSVNHFRTPEERRIGELAYYGEFFANLEFDDGYRTILYKMLLDYIAGKQSISDISLRVVEDTATRVRVLLELTAPNPSSLPDITQITTQLQRDYMMQPIRQSYPYGLRSDTALPLVVAAPPEGSPHHARYLIQQAESTIISLERDLTEASHRVATLSSSDDIVTGTLRTQTERLISQLGDQIDRAKGELANLIAAKYLELAQSPISDTQATIISPWQADAVIDIGAGGDSEAVSPRMLAWLEQSEQQYQKRNKALQGMIGGLMDQITSLAESVSQAKGVEILHTTGILSETDIVCDERGGFICRGSLVGKKSNIVWNGKQLHGFSLPGVDEIYHIIPIRKSGDIIETFWHRDRDGLDQYWYLEDGSYHLLDIAGHSIFKEIIFNGTDGQRGDIEDIKKPIGGKFQLSDGNWREFITINNKFQILIVNGTDIFRTISYSHSKNTQKTYSIYQRADNSLYQFVNTNLEGDNELLMIDEISMFPDMKINRKYLGYNNYNSRGLDLHLGNNKKMYIILGDPNKVLSIEGISQFENIEIDHFIENQPIYGEITTHEGLKKYFYREGDIYRFLGIIGEQEYKNIKIEKRGTNSIPLCFILESITGKKKCYYRDQEGGCYLLQYKGHTEFKEIQIYKIDDTSNRPYDFSLDLLDGKTVITGWKNILSFKFIETSSIKPIQLK